MDRLSTLIALLLMGTAPSMADKDAALQNPAPPKGSAFVRFIGAHEQKNSNPVLVNGRTYIEVDYEEVSPYFTFPEGQLIAQTGREKGSFNIQAGQFYTIVLSERGAVDEQQSDQVIAVNN